MNSSVRSALASARRFAPLNRAPDASDGRWPARETPMHVTVRTRGATMRCMTVHLPALSLIAVIVAIPHCAYAPVL